MTALMLDTQGAVILQGIVCTGHAQCEDYKPVRLRCFKIFVSSLKSWLQC